MDLNGISSLAWKIHASPDRQVHYNIGKWSASEHPKTRFNMFQRKVPFVCLLIPGTFKHKSTTPPLQLSRIGWKRWSVLIISSMSITFCVIAWGIQPSVSSCFVSSGKHPVRSFWNHSLLRKTLTSLERRKQKMAENRTNMHRHHQAVLLKNILGFSSYFNVSQVWNGIMREKLVESTSLLKHQPLGSSCLVSTCISLVSTVEFVFLMDFPLNR